MLEKVKITTRKIDGLVLCLFSVLIWLVLSGASDLIFQAKGPLFISEGLEGKVRRDRCKRGGVRDAWS